MDVNDNKENGGKNTGSKLLVLLIALGMMMPMFCNWEQYVPTNLQGGASWVASGLLLVLMCAFVWVNRRKQWLCLPPTRQLLPFVGVCIVLTLVTSPHIMLSPSAFCHCLVILVLVVTSLWLLMRRYSLILLAPIMLVGMFETGAHFRFKILLNSMLLAEALECSKDELMTYVTVTNISMLIAGVAFVAGVLYLLCRVITPMSKRSLGGLLLAMAALLYMMFPMLTDTYTNISHLGTFGTCKRSFRMFRDIKRASGAVGEYIESLPSPAEKPSEMPLLKDDDGCVIVFHIGESVRADRCGFNGYERDTTPNLSANPRLINWERCVASGHTTVNCLAALLTDARRDLDDINESNQEMKATCGSVMDLFKANGFAVHSFYGAFNRQSMRADKVLRMLTSASDERHYTNNDVMETVEQVKRCLQKTGNKNVFMFINNEGSHTHFYMYDQKNPPFTPSLHVVNTSPRYGDAIRNAYDNTIHYTDKFVHRVLEQLKGRPYVYVYVSDHGEYIGDYNGTWGRGKAISERSFFFSTQGGSGVSAFAVASPEYEQLNPQFAQAVAQLKESRRMTIGHEHFFHTLLGLVGMKTPYYNAELDLCSPEAKPYTGPEPEDWPDYLSPDK
ncbi:MAG: sulfatase-like hydrolase/transferase [Akkermansia sp.]|nr:sulfatase-like hydrolase/transferase [Akkermansia sp.]